MRYLGTGTAQASCSLVTERHVPVGPREDNTLKAEATWHNLVVWAGRGEAFSAEARAGDVVEIHGRMSNRSWDKDDGTKGYRSEVVVERFEIVEQAPRRPKAAAQAQQQRPASGFGQPGWDPRHEGMAAPPANAVASGDPDDLPFE